MMAMQMTFNGTTSCSGNWAENSWAELSNKCFIDAPLYVRYFDVILVVLAGFSIILAIAAGAIFARNKAERPDYRYLIWYWGPYLIMLVVFGIWVFTTHSTPKAVLTSIYAPISEDGLAVLSPEGVDLVYARAFSIILVVILLLTSQVAWVVILLQNPGSSNWMVVKYEGITGVPSTHYTFQMDGRKGQYRKSDFVFIGDSTFYLCHHEDRNLIELSIKKPSVAHVLCRYVRGKWSVMHIPNTSSGVNSVAGDGDPMVNPGDDEIQITGSVKIRLVRQW